MRNLLGVLAIACSFTIACDLTEVRSSSEALLAADARLAEGEILLECLPFTRRVRGVSSNYDAIQYAAVVTDVHPGDSFITKTCDYVQIPEPRDEDGDGEIDYPPTCPENHTCEGDLWPPGERCFTQGATGVFYGENLMVVCGSEQIYYDENGNVTSRTGGVYRTVTIVR